MSERTCAILLAFAAVLIAVGVGGWSWKAGLIVGGVLLAAWALFLVEPDAEEPKEAE